MPRSIRWRLPFSYAVIALLAALSLGVVLLITMRNYYLQRELDYLTDNARAISSVVADLVGQGTSPAALRSQLKSLSFLSQTRVRLLDETMQMVVDSGSPQQQEIAALSLLDPSALPTLSEGMFGGIPSSDVEIESDLLASYISRTTTTTLGSGAYRSFIVIEGERTTVTETVVITGSGLDSLLDSSEQLEARTGPLGFISRLPTVGTPYGFGFDADVGSDDYRSIQMVQHPFRDEGGNLAGYVELSEGPAYGLRVLESVVWGWGIAGAVAVVLAGSVGWLASRRISGPLLSLTGTTIRMAKGELTARANVTTQDEFGLLAQSFNEMADQVEETVVTLRRFATDAAHELHTPLTALRTNLELVASDEGDADRRARVDRALTQVARLTTLTESLLELSRIESGVLEDQHAPLDLIALVRETSELYASQAEQAGLSFHLELSSEVLLIQGNESQLRRALGNLLDNAIKFTPPGGEVRVGVRRDGDGAVLWVADTGIGILAADLPDLFSRFHRGRNAAGRPGNGLGLAIVKAIVESHSGQVLAGENVERGALFSLRLPTGGLPLQ